MRGAVCYSGVVIILEGCDGTGKTNLLGELSRDLMIPVHAKASTSTGGPVKNIWEWAETDVKTMHRMTFSIYDRHPLVSELIYGPIIRKSVDERFRSDEGTELCKLFAESVLIVFCDPGYLEVKKNIEANPHMPGVTEHWEQIYEMYQTLMQYWPGEVVRWDYRAHWLYPYLRAHCVNYMALRKTEYQR